MLDHELEFADSKKLIHLELKNRKMFMQFIKQQFAIAEGDIAVNHEIPNYGENMKL